MKEINYNSDFEAGVELALECFAEARNGDAEDNRMLTIKASGPSEWLKVCLGHVSVMALSSRFMERLHRHADKLGGKRVPFGAPIFNPVSGDTAVAVFTGIRPVDMMPITLAMPADEQEAEARFEKVRKKALNFVLDIKNGEEPPDFLKQARDLVSAMGIDPDCVRPRTSDDEEGSDVE